MITLNVLATYKGRQICFSRNWIRRLEEGLDNSGGLDSQNILILR